MKTHVVMATYGCLVSDDAALEFAKKNIGADSINIGTGVMLDAFRLLRVRGEIEELIITFCNGDTHTTDEFAQIANWPQDPIVDAETMILSGIIGWDDKSNQQKS